MAGERVSRTGLAVPESGFFGKEFTVEDLGKLGRGVQAAYKGAEDIYTGVIDPVNKKLQEIAREKEIREARIEAANVALAADEATAGAERVVEDASVAARDAEAAADLQRAFQLKMPGAPQAPYPGLMERPQLRMDPALAPSPTMPQEGILPESRLERADADLQRRAVLARLGAPSGAPLGPQRQTYGMPMAPPAAPAIPASMRPGPPRGVSPTGAMVSPLQGRVSAAPARAQAPQAPRAAPAQAAAPAGRLLSDDRALLSDPANRAYVREIMRQASNAGTPMRVDQALDLLKLEIAKRDVPARGVVDTQYGEILEMEPSDAAAMTDITGMFRVAENSTLADWPRIERVAREVIKRQKRGFFELTDMKGQLKEIYDRIPKPVGTKGVEFDLKGPAERAKLAAQAKKTLRRTGRGRGRGRRGKLDKYLTTTKKPDPLTAIPTYQWHVKKEFGEGGAKALDRGVLDQVRAEANRRNKKEGVLPGKAELGKEETRQRIEQQDAHALNKAKSLVRQLDAEIVALEREAKRKPYTGDSTDRRYKLLKGQHDTAENTRIKGVNARLSPLKKERRGAQSDVDKFTNIVQ
jgi:hypothetical protein